MKIKPLSLIDDDNNSSKTHSSSKFKKSNKDEDDIDTINNKKSIISGKSIKNVETEKKGNELKNLGVNNQQKIVNDFRCKVNKEKLFQLNLKKNIIQNNNIINENPSDDKETKEQQDINYIIKNEDKKENKLSKNLLNDKKDKRKSYHGKIYFFIAILMLVYQYCSYILLIELPIIQSK